MARAQHLAVLLGLLGASLSAETADRMSIDAWVELYDGTLERGADGRVIAIDLSRSWVGDTDLAYLEGLDRLERLSLAQTHVSDHALEIVAALPSLRELDLFFCEHITDSGASRLRRAAKLERLNVRGTKISDSGVKFLTDLESLRSLDIGITEIGDPAIELLEDLPGLETLAIGGNRVGEVGISALRALKQLRHLDLSGAQVTDSGIWAVSVTDLNLDEVASLLGLESLNLAAPSPEYVDSISTGVPRLRGAIRVTDFGASHLAELKTLRRLDVSRSTLSAIGLDRLGSLDRLEELLLAHASLIDDSAGPALARFPALRVLDVSFTRFGDEGLAALRDHAGLQRLVAVGTKGSEAAAREFSEARPGRSVIR